MSRLTIPRFLGSTLAGAIGFMIGFYAGFFLVLSIWGIEAPEAGFLVFTVGLGSLGAGIGVALTVIRPRRLAAAVTALGLGILLGLLSWALGVDAAGVWVGGLVLAAVTTVLVRAGNVDFLPG